MEPPVQIPGVDRISTLRHDVMNPLTVVICYAKLLLGRDDLTPRVREYVSMMASEAERCVEIFEADKAAHDRAAAAVQPAAEPVRPGSVELRSDPVRILIVEDDEGIRLLTTEVLRTGFADNGIPTIIEAATSRAHATRLVEEAPYDLMVIDLNIDTAGGGLDLLASLDSIRSGAATRTVMVSGGAMDNLTLKMLDRMSIPLLEKPFAIADLVRIALRIAGVAT